MEQSLPFSQLNSFFNPAVKVVILIGSASLDELTAGVSLALSLEEAGKKVSVFAPQLSGTQPGLIKGLEKVKTNFDQKDLLIFLDYPLSNIEKVSSQEENDCLRLVVKVKPGSGSIQANQVKVVSQNFDYETGVLIGDETLFSGFKQAVSQGKWVWIGRNSERKSWAQISLPVLNSSYSEIIARVVQGLGLPMNRDIAGNLFEGMKMATGSFSNLVSYKTLETAALCFKVIEGSNQEVDQKLERQAKGELDRRIPLDLLESKEGGPVNLPTPRIFKGATTPRI